MVRDRADRLGEIEMSVKWGKKGENDRKIGKMS